MARSSENAVALLEQHGFDPIIELTPGGHTWISWRLYLNEFAPKLFQ